MKGDIGIANYEKRVEQEAAYLVVQLARFFVCMSPYRNLLRNSKFHVHRVSRMRKYISLQSYGSAVLQLAGLRVVGCSIDNEDTKVQNPRPDKLQIVPIRAHRPCFCVRKHLTHARKRFRTRENTGV